jgi:Kef-type K+ transport system membrane component KefB
LFIIALIAAAVPLLIGLLRLPVPEVVLLIAAGAIAGPYALDLIHPDDAIELLKTIGLAFLFFIAGYELDQQAIKGRSGRLAVIGWFVSVALAMVVVLALESRGFVQDGVAVAIALTSTALGTLLPILRDRGVLGTPFGRYFQGAGAIGEFGPIRDPLLLGSRSSWASMLIIVAFAVLAVLIYLIPPRLVTPRLLRVVDRTRDTSAQSGVRWVLVLLFGLLALAGIAGLDVVLGAFVAGVVLRPWANQEAAVWTARSRHRVRSSSPVLHHVRRLARPALDRGQPGPAAHLLHVAAGRARCPAVVPLPPGDPRRRRAPQFMLYVATGLPIIVAVTTIG